MAALDLGKWPRVFTIRCSCMCRLLRRAVALCAATPLSGGKRARVDIPEKRGNHHFDLIEVLFERAKKAVFWPSYTGGG